MERFEMKPATNNDDQIHLHHISVTNIISSTGGLKSGSINVLVLGNAYLIKDHVRTHQMWEFLFTRFTLRHPGIDTSGCAVFDMERLLGHLPCIMTGSKSFQAWWFQTVPKMLLNLPLATPQR
jgi:hypothetical protein